VWAGTREVEGEKTGTDGTAEGGDRGRDGRDGGKKKNGSEGGRGYGWEKSRPHGHV